MTFTTEDLQLILANYSQATEEALKKIDLVTEFGWPQVGDSYIDKTGSVRTCENAFNENEQSHKRLIVNNIEFVFSHVGSPKKDEYYGDPDSGKVERAQLDFPPTHVRTILIPRIKK